METAPLQAVDVVGGYEEREVLHGVSLDIPEAQMTALIGPNGSGKSTMMRVLAGVLKPASGQVLLQGEPLAEQSRREVARSIAVVPQMTTMLFSFTSLEYVMMGRTPHLGRLEGESEQDRQIARQAMEQTDITHLADRPVTELSGGELQRLTVARALAQQASIIMLDEPTSFLDINHQLQILRMLRQLRDGGRTVMCISHDLNLTATFFDRVAMLKAGEIVAVGPPSEIITHELIQDVYDAEVVVDATVEGNPRVTVTARPAGEDMS